MDNIRVLVPNKNKNKFFGVDYFANLYDGSKESFKYFASSIDELMIFKDESVNFNQEKFAAFKIKSANLEENAIIGFFQNPDIYQALDSIDFLLDELSKNNLGLFLETSSDKILNDLDKLIEFSKQHPLLIAFPVSSYSNKDLSIFNDLSSLESVSKTLHKLVDAGLNTGIILKPLIPKINDEVEELVKIIDKCDSLNLNFIYPSFTLYFDSYKIKNFYDIIDKEKPELKNFYFDKFGYKYSWESQNLSELKKVLVFNSKKSKIKYAMKDIIDLYRKDAFTQLKLF